MSRTIPLGPPGGTAAHGMVSHYAPRCAEASSYQGYDPLLAGACDAVTETLFPVLSRNVVVIETVDLPAAA